jgi:urease accessory protein
MSSGERLSFLPPARQSPAQPAPAGSARPGQTGLPRAGVQSQLRADFEQHDGVTRLVSKYHTAPVKIAKTFPLGGPLGVIVMDVSPGLMAGDRYEFDWNAGRGTHLTATNQSFTKVHPCPDASRGSSVRQRFALGEGAVFEWMPEPVMLYRDAALKAETEVYLGEGAVFMQSEVLCPGRLPRGERFDYRQYGNRMNVYLGDELICAQHQRIVPSRQRLQAPGCFGDATHTGAFYVFSDRLTAQHIEAVRQAFESLPARGDKHVTAGVSATHKHGLAVLAAGTSAWPLQEALAAVWGAVRASLLGLPPLRLHH